MATFSQCSRYCCLFLIRRRGPRQEDGLLVVSRLLIVVIPSELTSSSDWTETSEVLGTHVLPGSAFLASVTAAAGSGRARAKL